MNTYKKQKINSNLPTGSIIAFAGTVAPKGFLLCDGSFYQVCDYPELYEVIGQTYSEKKSKNFFAVPDLRSRVVFGATPLVNTPSTQPPPNNLTEYELAQTGGLESKVISFEAPAGTRVKTSAPNSTTVNVGDLVNPPYVALYYIIKY